MKSSKISLKNLKLAVQSRYGLKVENIIRKKNKLGPSLSGRIMQISEELEEFSPIHWNLTVLLENLLYLKDTIPTLSDEEEFGELEDEVFERWAQSEFAENFLKNLNSGLSLKKASLKSLKELEGHIDVFIRRHILKKNVTNKFYSYQPSLGEEIIKGKLIQGLETTLVVEEKELKLRTPSLTHMRKFSQRIEKALRVIKEHSPESWESFKVFTQAIIPIKNKEFVSYSHQDLPGFSMINLYHRDFVDLIDDLIHENGHHHLNYHLNLKPLIKEPVENDFYSPWRRSPRPIRGLFHGFFTFYWAFKLFKDLALSDLSSNKIYNFSKEELHKINFRVVEEFYMLEFAFVELMRAKDMKLLSKPALKLIEAQMKDVTSSHQVVKKLERNLGKYRSEVSDLKKHLARARKDFTY